METNEVKIARLEEQMAGMIKSFDRLETYIKERDEDFKKWFMSEINNSAGSLRSDVNQANSRGVDNRTLINENKNEIAEVKQELATIKIELIETKETVKELYDAYQKGVFIGKLTKSAWAVFAGIVGVVSVIINMVLQLISK